MADDSLEISLLFLEWLKEHLPQIVQLIEQTIIGPEFTSPVPSSSSPCFHMMVRAMFLNFGRCVMSASPKHSFFRLPTVSTGYRFSTSFMPMLLMDRLTTTGIDGKKYRKPRLFRSLSNFFLSHSLCDHTSSGAMVSFLKRDYKHAIKALVTRGEMKGFFFDLLLAMMNCSMIPGVMYMHDANPLLGLQFAMKILPQLHPGQIEMRFLLQLVLQLIDIALGDIHQIKFSVFDPSDDKADPPEENYAVVGGFERYEMFMKFLRDLIPVSSRIESIIIEFDAGYPGMDRVSESIECTLCYFRNSLPYPDHLPNLPPLLQEDPAAGASAD